MEPTFQAPLTPEQLAAIHAGGGFARCEDPTTQVRYELIQCESQSIEDDYVRQKIDESYADSSSVAPLDMPAIQAELQRRVAAKNQSER